MNVVLGSYTHTTHLPIKVEFVRLFHTKLHIDQCIMSPTPSKKMGQYCFACWRLFASVVVVICNTASGQLSRLLGARAVGRPTLHGGPVVLRPVTATPCFSCTVMITTWIKCMLKTNLQSATSPSLPPAHWVNSAKHNVCDCDVPLVQPTDKLKETTSCLNLAHWPHYVKTCCHPQKRKYMMFDRATTTGKMYRQGNRRQRTSPPVCNLLPLYRTIMTSPNSA